MQESDQLISKDPSPTSKVVKPETTSQEAGAPPASPSAVSRTSAAHSRSSSYPEQGAGEPAKTRTAQVGQKVRQTSFERVKVLMSVCTLSSVIF